MAFMYPLCVLLPRIIDWVPMVQWLVGTGFASRYRLQTQSQCFKTQWVGVYICLSICVSICMSA